MSGIHAVMIRTARANSMTSQVIARMSATAYPYGRGMVPFQENEMQRRQFFEAAFGAVAANMLGGCATRTETTDSISAANSVATADAFDAARRYIEIPQGHIAYVDRGRGHVALFLHGFPLNGFQWRGAIDRLAPHRRCLAPDFMGLGYSKIAEGQSVAPTAQVSMLAALLDKLSIDAVDLVANDSGGAVAQLFMLRYPQRVRTLLLTNCDVEPDSPPPALKPVIEMARNGTFADKWLAAWVANKELARSASGLGGQTYTYPEKLSDATIDYYLAPLVSSSERKAQVHAYTLALDPNPLAGIEAALRKSTVPTRIVWGTGDDIFSQDSPAYLDRILPGSRGVRRIPGAKLFFPEEFPDAIAEEAQRLWGVS